MRVQYGIHGMPFARLGASIAGCASAGELLLRQLIDASLGHESLHRAGLVTVVVRSCLENQPAVFALEVRQQVLFVEVIPILTPN